MNLADFIQAGLQGMAPVSPTQGFRGGVPGLPWMAGGPAPNLNMFSIQPDTFVPPIVQAMQSLPPAPGPRLPVVQPWVGQALDQGLGALTTVPPAVAGPAGPPPSFRDFVQSQNAEAAGPPATARLPSLPTMSPERRAALTGIAQPPAKPPKGPDGAVARAGAPTFSWKAAEAQAGKPTTMVIPGPEAAAGLSDQAFLDAVERYDKETWASMGGRRDRILPLKGEEGYRVAIEKAAAGDPTFRDANATGATGAGRAGTGGAYGIPDPKEVTAAALPAAPKVLPQSPVDTTAFDRFDSLKAIQPEPMTTGDRVTNLLAAMASGAQGAKNFADVLLGAGAGAARGAAGNIAQERAASERAKERALDLEILKAGKGVDRAKVEAENRNLPITAQNEQSRLDYSVGAEQAKLTAAAQSTNVENANQIALARAKLGMPHVQKLDGGGYMVSQVLPNGSTKITQQTGQGLDKLLDQLKDSYGLKEKGDPVGTALHYETIGQRFGEGAVRRQIMRDLVEGGHAPNVLGSQYKKVEDAAKKDPTLIQLQAAGGDKYRKALLEKMVDLIEAQNLPDERWLPYMASIKNYGALRMLQPGQ